MPPKGMLSPAATSGLENEPAVSTSIDDPIWHRTLGALIEALDRPNFWKVLVRYLGDAVSFDSWVVLCFRHDGRPVVYAESPSPDGGEDALFREYLDGFYMLDPFYLACMDEPRPGLLRLDDVAPDNFEAEEYYQRYFRLNIVKDEVQFNLPLSPGRVLVLSLGATHRYSAQEMTVLNTIAPWLLALMRQRVRGNELAEPRDVEVTVPAPPPVLDLAGSLVTTGLTGRELEIVHLLLSGFSSKGIAQKLGISPETVKAHRRHIYSKLGVKSHAELFTILLRARAQPPRAEPGDERA